jgi:hypothetical protein
LAILQDFMGHGLGKRNDSRAKTRPQDGML